MFDGGVEVVLRWVLKLWRWLLICLVVFHCSFEVARETLEVALESIELVFSFSSRV